MVYASSSFSSSFQTLAANKKNKTLDRQKEMNLFQDISTVSKQDNIRFK